MSVHRELQDYFSKGPPVLKEYLSGIIGDHEIMDAQTEVPLLYGGHFSSNRMASVDVLYFVASGGMKLMIPGEIKENPRYATKGIRQIWAACIGLSSSFAKDYEIPFGIVISGSIEDPHIISRDFRGKTRNF
ncbi:MAG: hypothetical protein HY364_04365 [Candidatus Aenigmarchaeota archaeon]|nr:hypothetical protein [Candidatus Aenigmarchaeota archaeon]